MRIYNPRQGPILFFCICFAMLTAYGTHLMFMPSQVCSMLVQFPIWFVWAVYSSAEFNKTVIDFKILTRIKIFLELSLSLSVLLVSLRTFQSNGWSASWEKWFLPLPVLPVCCGLGAFVVWTIFLFYCFLSMDASDTLRIWQLKVRFCRTSLAVYIMGLTS